MSTVINSSNVLAEMEKLKALSAKPPASPAAALQPDPSFASLTLDQINSKIEEFSLALEEPLPDPVRDEILRRRAALVKEQFKFTHGYLPDEFGNDPQEAAIAATATQKVLDTLNAASESALEVELPDVDEAEEDGEENIEAQIEAMNEFDEADAVVEVAPTESATTISTPSESLRMPQAVVLSSEEVMVLRASLRANLTHTVLKVLSAALLEK
jgi:hypothetical protein